MTKILICYKFENLPLSKRNQFKRKLFGAEEKTHKGRYTAVTKGYLSEKLYEKPIRSVIITSKKYIKKIIQILKEFNAQYWIFEIKSRMN